MVLKTPPKQEEVGMATAKQRRDEENKCEIVVFKRQEAVLGGLYLGFEFRHGFALQHNPSKQHPPQLTCCLLWIREVSVRVFALPSTRISKKKHQPATAPILYAEERPTTLSLAFHSQSNKEMHYILWERQEEEQGEMLSDNGKMKTRRK